MKECFRKKRWIKTHLLIVELANQIIEEYAADGYTLTLRQIYYQFIRRDWFPADWIDVEYNRKKGLPDDTKNTLKNYKSLGEILSDARYAGLVDWDAIEDRGRVLKRNPNWKTPGDIISSAAYQFRHDKWSDQPCYVEVMVEKQALEGILIPVCADLDVAFMSNKGYTSSSAMYEAGKRYQRRISDGKKVHLIYLGDHDPSGIDMSRDIDDRTDLFTYGKQGVQLHRIALNLDQVQKMDLPPNPAKLTDSRVDGYIRKFGEDSWELDAIEPKDLVKLVTKKVKSLRDEKLWKAAVERENTAREVLTKLSEEFKTLD